MKQNITVTFDSKDDGYVVKKKSKSKLTLQEIQEAVTEHCGADELMFVIMRTGYWDDTAEMIMPADSDNVKVYSYVTMKRIMKNE